MLFRNHRSAAANSGLTGVRAARLNAAELSTRGNALGTGGSEQVAVLFTDFECPFCKAYSLTIDSVLRANPGFRVVERHYPLSALHPAAFNAALAAECAAHVGKYADMRRALYRDTRMVEEERWGSLAALAGVADTNAVMVCVQSRQFASAVDADLTAAQHLSILETEPGGWRQHLRTGARRLATYTSLDSYGETTHRGSIGRTERRWAARVRV